ncbi:MAG TPA: ClpXP protease specificity-enhancing factor SspB [Myxococcota bacterium]
MTEHDDNQPADNVVRVDFSARRAKPKPPPAAVRSQPPSSTELSADRPEKLRMFARLIEKGMVMVTVDTRAADVRVPPRFGGELQLNLNFSHRFGLDDFDYDDVGVRASLSFGGTPHFCELPWTAVYGMTSHVDGERLLWPDSFPKELVSLLPAQARHPREPELDVRPAETSTDGGDEDPPPTSPRPTLRRIK